MAAEVVEISQRMGSISIESTGDGSDHGNWVDTIPADDTDAPESVIELPDASDAVSDTESTAGDGFGPAGSRCTKKKLGLVLLAMMAFLGVAIGLGVGLGTKKNNSSNNIASVTSSSSAAHDAVTLEECLAIEEEESAVNFGSKQSPFSQMLKESDESEDVPSETAAAIEESNSFSNDAEEIASGDEMSNDGVELIMAGSAVVGGTPSGDTMIIFKSSLRRASNDSVGLSDGSTRRKTRRLQKCAELIKEAGASR